MRDLNMNKLMVGILRQATYVVPACAPVYLFTPVCHWTIPCQSASRLGRQRWQKPGIHKRNSTFWGHIYPIDYWMFLHLWSPDNLCFKSWSKSEVQ